MPRRSFTCHLFQSEEHARAWPRFDPTSDDGIRPISEYVAILLSSACRVYRERLASDYLLRIGELSRAFAAALTRLDRGSPFWEPHPTA